MHARTAALVAVVLVVATAGCQQIGGRTIMVEFSSADGVQSGQPVYFAGVVVGNAGAPAIVRGKARVPVHLARRHRDALTTGAVFAIADDPNHPGSHCLLGYAVSSVPRRTEDGTEVYQGVSNEVELALIVGAAKAKEFWESFDK